jgi:hypothetical protein
MHYLALSVTLFLVPLLVQQGQSQAPNRTGEATVQTPSAAQAPSAAQTPAPGPKQLLAVRGEIIKVTNQSKGLLAITVRPAKDFAEVTVIARENEMVACSSAREGGADLFGLLAGEDQREDEKITAAELHEGDIVSIIYNPHLRNKALEIYLH